MDEDAPKSKSPDDLFVDSDWEYQDSEEFDLKKEGKQEKATKLDQPTALELELKTLRKDFETYKTKSEARFEALEGTRGLGLGLTEVQSASESGIEGVGLGLAPDATDQLTSKIQELEAALSSAHLKISQMEQDHEAALRGLADQYESVYEVRMTGPDDLIQSIESLQTKLANKDSDVARLEGRIMDLNAIIEAQMEGLNVEDPLMLQSNLSLKQRRVEHLKNVVSRQAYELGRLRKKAGVAVERCSQTEEKYVGLGLEGNESVGLAPQENVGLGLEARGSVGLETKESVDLGFTSQDTLGLAPPDQKSISSTSQDQSTLDLASLQSALSSAHLKLTQMEKEHQEAINLMTEALDNANKMHQSSPELAVRLEDLQRTLEWRDFQVKTLEETNREFLMLLQGKMEESERYQKEVREIRTSLEASCTRKMVEVQEQLRTAKEHAQKLQAQVREHELENELLKDQISRIQEKYDALLLEHSNYNTQ